MTAAEFQAAWQERALLVLFSSNVTSHIQFSQPLKKSRLLAHLPISCPYCGQSFSTWSCLEYAFAKCWMARVCAAMRSSFYSQRIPKVKTTFSFSICPSFFSLNELKIILSFPALNLPLFESTFSLISPSHGANILALPPHSPGWLQMSGFGEFSVLQVLLLLQSHPSQELIHSQLQHAAICKKIYFCIYLDSTSF